jgi:glycine betaine catabolism B
VLPAVMLVTLRCDQHRIRPWLLSSQSSRKVWRSKTGSMKRWLQLITLSLVLMWAATAPAQTSPQDHAAHHPGQKPMTADAKPSASPMSGGSPAPGQMGGMMEGGMDKMMERMGAPPKELYPSLMDLPSLPPERRAEIERLAQARMTAGKEQMTAAGKILSDAASREDYAAMQQATSQMREALAQFESGLAARRALAEGKAPRNIAQQWFKQDMNLLPAASIEPTQSVFGLPWLHYFVIFILTAFAASMVLMYFHKMRRAEALLAQLASGAVASPAVGGTGATPVASAAILPTPLAAPVAPAVVAAKWSGQLRVARIFQETADAKTFRFAPPEGGEFLPFTFDPGQFLTVSVNVDGQELKRSYSISSSPCCQGWCEITVKHVAGGRVSAYLHEQVREGDLLNVSAPSGRFTFRGKEAPSVVFIAGGVGITPLMSSIRYLTDQSWPGEIFLIYACASLKDIIFREELEYLQQRHPKLHITITLSKEESPDWPGPRGVVSKELLLSVVPDIAARRVHLCGPPPMMDAVKKLLAEIGVPAKQVKTELFLSPEPRRAATATAEPANVVSAPAQAAQAPVCTFARSVKSAPLPPDKTVLEASEDVGVNIDNSCREGYCGVCKTKLLAGQVTMAVEDALDESDKAQNIILACQAKSAGDVTVEA